MRCAEARYITCRSLERTVTSPRFRSVGRIFVVDKLLDNSGQFRDRPEWRLIKALRIYFDGDIL